MMTEYMMNFQNPNSTTMWYLYNLNNSMMILMITLLLTTSWLMKNTVKMKKMMEKDENNKMETLWTIIPSFILMSIALPSMTILYSMEEIPKTMMNIKILASQWFWTYEYPQMKNMKMDSIMMKSKKMRCLKTSNPMIMLSNIPTMMIISSNDVIHSFSINQMGTKMDAIPGRINSMIIEPIKSGMMTGQCSEICGMNHSFMPIMINSMNMKSM